MFTLLLVIGILWLGLKILTLMIELPFRILGAFFRRPLSTLFWIILLVGIIGLVF